MASNRLSYAQERIYTDSAPSTAAIAGHPIHPMLIPFPVAFLPAALVTDIVYAWTANEFWAQASFWLLAGGLVTGALAAIFGLIDFFTIQRVRDHTAGWLHFLGNATVLVLTAVNLWLRWANEVDAVTPWGVLVSLAVTILLVITGWYGGELSYRHKVGVME
jgi:uncharacterized membrane protein